MDINISLSKRNIIKKAIEYFFVIFFLLIVLTGVIFVLLFQSLLRNILLFQQINLSVNILYLFIVIILIAGFLSWFLTRNEIIKRKQLLKLSLFNQIISNISECIIIHDLEGKILLANDAVRSLLGYKNNNFLNANFYSFGGKEKEFITKYEPLKLGDLKEIYCETEMRKKDSSIVPVSIYSRIIELNGHNVLLSIFNDITEKITISEKLLESSTKLKRAMEGTINTLALTSEIRDPYTAGHQQRVAKLAVAIAREIGFNEERIEGIHVAARLHDIGKIYVPAEILSKPGKLKANEFNLVKDHAQVGYELLKSIEFPWPIADVVLQHHERLDGSGYPNGLKTKDILPEAAIIAVSDVVESMASHRPYRPAYNIEKALLEILQYKGDLYYPDAVDACIKLFNENGFKF